jgi:hypothetical protein
MNSWLHFLTEAEGSGVDLDWMSRCVNALRYAPPPPARAGHAGPVSGMAERDAQVRALYQENYELKVCVAALVEVLTRHGLATRESLANMIERLSLGFNPAGGSARAESEGDNPLADLG